MHAYWVEFSQVGLAHLLAGDRGFGVVLLGFAATLAFATDCGEDR